MNYEKKYKEALERAAFYNNELLTENQRKMLLDIFPELQESEDEKMKDYIKDVIQAAIIPKKENKQKMIAWLEKQGEPKDKGEISDGYHTFNELYTYRMLYNAAFFNLLPKEIVHKSKRHHDGEECFGGGWFVVMANLPTGQISNHYELKYWDLFQIPEKEIADEWDGHTPQEAAERLHRYLIQEAADRLHRYLLEKQGEQPAAKIDTKFKVGDWIVNTHNRLIWQITCIRNSLYYLRDVNGNEGYETYDGLQDNYRLWSISDARDGDILACNKEILLFKSASALGYISLHCWYNGQTNRFHSKAVYDTLMTTRNKICPATKEQQDLFIKKMKEAGYEWDAEKKELKKMEVKSENIEPKPLDADKVIGWLVANICDFEYYVKRFKEDFGL